MVRELTLLFQQQDHFCMSLTSTELNYLVWRYLQESGYDLAAYALEKGSQCQEYEKSPLPIESKIPAGCLVNLVQKGILFTLAEAAADLETGQKPERLTLFGSLIQEELVESKLEESKKQQEEEQKKYLLKSDDIAEKENVEMEEANGDTIENAVEPEIEFTTKIMTPNIKFDESLVSDWHPQSEVFAYGRADSVAMINAIKDNAIAESVTLNHPNMLNRKNEINIVSWSPLGNMIVTAGSNGELRAWSPDGKLKNIANTFNEDLVPSNPELESRDKIQPSIITNLIWSDNGQLLLSVDSNNQVGLWDGATLSSIKQIKLPTSPADLASFIDACWLNEDSFAVSTTKNSIKIYSITKPAFGTSTQQDVQTIGYLHGHENGISILNFNTESRLLASCSDYDYAIKVWARGSAQDSLDLNVNPTKSKEIKLHSSPIIGLFWLDNIGENGVLLSISMEGVVNIWHASTGDVLKSTELFKNEDNFKYVGDTKLKVTSELLIFNAAVSPNKKYLAIGDDLGRVTIWDIVISRYSSKGSKDFLRCLGAYDFQIPDSSTVKDSGVGICDLRWDSKSKNICISYKGAESVIFNWE